MDAMRGTGAPNWPSVSNTDQATTIPSSQQSLPSMIMGFESAPLPSPISINNAVQLSIESPINVRQIFDQKPDFKFTMPELLETHSPSAIAFAITSSMNQWKNLQKDYNMALIVQTDTGPITLSHRYAAHWIYFSQIKPNKAALQVIFQSVSTSPIQKECNINDIPIQINDISIIEFILGLLPYSNQFSLTESGTELLNILCFHRKHQSVDSTNQLFNSVHIALQAMPDDSNPEIHINTDAMIFRKEMGLPRAGPMLEFLIVYITSAAFKTPATYLQHKNTTINLSNLEFKTVRLIHLIKILHSELCKHGNLEKQIPQHLITFLQMLNLKIDDLEQKHICTANNIPITITPNELIQSCSMTLKSEDAIVQKMNETMHIEPLEKSFWISNQQYVKLKHPLLTMWMNFSQNAFDFTILTELLGLIDIEKETLVSLNLGFSTIELPLGWALVYMLSNQLLENPTLKQCLKHFMNKLEMHPQLIPNSIIISLLNPDSPIKKEITAKADPNILKNVYDDFVNQIREIFFHQKQIAISDHFAYLYQYAWCTKASFSPFTHAYANLLGPILRSLEINLNERNGPCAFEHIKESSGSWLIFQLYETFRLYESNHSQDELLIKSKPLFREWVEELYSCIFQNSELFSNIRLASINNRSLEWLLNSADTWLTQHISISLSDYVKSLAVLQPIESPYALS